MEDKKDIIKKAFVDDKENYNKKIVPTPVKEKNIGIDTHNELLYDISDAGDNSALDLSRIQSFHQTALSRNKIYEYLDTMGEDATIAAVLETYAEDITDYNDEGDIVWAEATDANISKHINYLLSEIQVNKHIYQWAFNLVKYGDVYIRLFRNSDYELNDDKNKKDKNTLNEDLIIKAYRKNDHYSHYVEMVPNPAQMFELTRLGKSYAYIEAPVPVLKKTDNPYEDYQFNYKFDYGDVTLYSPTEFVHAALEDTSNRSPEKVELFLNKDTLDGTEAQLDTSFSVKRGQSILYNLYKIWRQKQLLEDSILLNRVTKSSLVRILNIEIGDMDKNKVPQHVQKVKQLVEQKTAINTGMSMSDYTNPGPVENTIYIPTRNGIGKIESQEIGTNITDVKNLADLDYFNNLLFGALRVPKQFFAQTDDSTGFNGGTSLTIISSRYARTIKRVQNVLIQAITDILNLFLMDSGLDFYVNKFTIKMVAPITQEEIDKKDNESKELGITRDINEIIGDNIEDKLTKLKLLKAMLSTNIQNQEVLDLLQEEIEKEEQADEDTDSLNESVSDEEMDNMKIDNDTMSEISDTEDLEPTGGEEGVEETSEETSEEDINLESPEELNVDMTQNV